MHATRGRYLTFTAWQSAASKASVPPIPPSPTPRRSWQTCFETASGTRISYLFLKFELSEVNTVQRTPGLVVFAGRVVAAKGLDVLIRALPDIRGTLAVCGDGWAAPRASRLARELSVEDKVEFLGWATDADLQPLRRASVVAVPSLWPEPFGLTGIEAMSNGVPVVGSNTGGILRPARR